MRPHQLEQRLMLLERKHWFVTLIRSLGLASSHDRWSVIHELSSDPPFWSSLNPSFERDHSGPCAFEFRLSVVADCQCKFPNYLALDRRNQFDTKWSNHHPRRLRLSLHGPDSRHLVDRQRLSQLMIAGYWRQVRQLTTEHCDPGCHTSILHDRPIWPDWLLNHRRTLKKILNHTSIEWSAKYAR